MSGLSYEVDVLAGHVYELMDDHKAALRELDLAADTIERQKNEVKRLRQENLRLSLALEERGRQRMEFP